MWSYVCSPDPPYRTPPHASPVRPPTFSHLPPAQHRNVMYQHNHARAMSVSATAQLLSNTLYYKRFFPFYTFNLCAGLDDEGGCGGGGGRGRC